MKQESIVTRNKTKHSLELLKDERNWVWRYEGKRCECERRKCQVVDLTSYMIYLRKARMLRA
jgi:hypothetical protein